MKLMLLLVFAGCAALAAATGKTLVLVDNWAIRETHSIYFKTLRGMYK